MDDFIFVCRGKSIEQVKAETQDSIVLGFFVMLKYMLRVICFGLFNSNNIKYCILEKKIF